MWGAERTVSLEGHDGCACLGVFSLAMQVIGPWPLAVMIPAGSGQEYADKSSVLVGP